MNTQDFSNKQNSSNSQDASLSNHAEESIHNFDFSLICDYFSSIERQGPGNEEATLRALQLVGPLPQKAKIADLGCGTGTQTLTIAAHTDASIVGLDLFPQFIDRLNERCKKAGLEHQVTGIVGDMGALPFEEQSLDLIWSEGAIYNVGFQKGINLWKTYLKPGGWIAVTDATWLTEERPEEIEQFWLDAYPEIDTLPHKVKQLEEAGYRHIQTFILPQACWTDSFYQPQQEAQRVFLQRHPKNDTARMLVENQRHEAELYERYHDFYGYVFYVASL